jgi:hypothetical protein
LTKSFLRTCCIWHSFIGPGSYFLVGATAWIFEPRSMATCTVAVQSLF